MKNVYFGDECICQFNGKYYFLSNYYTCDITHMGLTFKNAEAAFQSQKCPEMSHKFCNLTPNNAKSLGRRVPLRDDWESIKDFHMYAIIKTKFSDQELKKQLIATYPKQLIEGNTWNDTYWGVDIKRGKGLNKLGKILMEVRDMYMREETGEDNGI